MKTKNFIISFVLMLSLLVTAFAFTPSTVDALEVSVKVEEVAITLPAPAAGATVYRDNASVTVKHHMTYKVVGLNWYKDYNPNGSNDKLGVDSNADTFFKGGESYTVRVDLELKGANSGWNFEFDGENTDYSGISATVNGGCDICGYKMVAKEEPKGLSGGAIAGIVVGGVAIVGIGGFSVFWFVIKKKSFADLIAIFSKK